MGAVATAGGGVMYMEATMPKQNRLKSLRLIHYRAASLGKAYLTISY